MAENSWLRDTAMREQTSKSSVGLIVVLIVTAVLALLLLWWVVSLAGMVETVLI